MKNNVEYSSVFNLGNKKKILVRNPQLMDPRNAARYVKKGYKLSTNQDWDYDGVNDVVLLDNNNKIRSFNGYEQRPSDWIYKQQYYSIPKTERPTYKEFIDNDIYGQEIDENNWEYKQNTQHIVKGWKQPKSSKIPSANKLFEKVSANENNPRATRVICVETGEVFDCIKFAMQKYNIKSVPAFFFIKNT